MNLDIIKEKIKDNPYEIRKYVDELTDLEILELMDINVKILDAMFGYEERFTKEMVEKYYFKKYKVLRSMKSILEDDEFVERMIKKSEYFYNAICEILPYDKLKKHFKFVEDKCTKIINDTPDIFKHSSTVALNCIKNDIDQIIFFYSDAITNDVIEYLFSKNYQYNEKKYLYFPHAAFGMFENELIILYLMKQDINFFYKAKGNAISEKTVEYALTHGIKYDYDSYLLNNPVFLKKVLEMDSNILNYTKQKLITSELIDIAVKNKYKFSFVGKRESKKNRGTYEGFSDDIEYIVENNLFLLDYPKLVMSTCENGYKEIIFEEIIKDLSDPYFDNVLDDIIKNKIEIKTFRNLRLLENEKFRNYVENSLFSDSRSKELLYKYINIFPKHKLLYQLKKLSTVLSPSFIDIFGENKIYLIVKYLIVSDDTFEIDNVLNYISPVKLKNITDRLINLKCEELYILEFKKIVNFFSNNLELLKNIKNDENINIRNLIYLIDNQENIKCTTKDELNHLHNIRYEYYDNNKEINIKDKMTMYLCGKDYITVSNFLHNEFNRKIIIDYKENFKNADLIKLIDYSKFLDYLYNIIDLSEEELYNEWNLLKSNTLSMYSFSELDSLKKEIYSNIYKSKLTDLSIKNPTRYENDVPIYEYNGEEFSFIVHVINSFDYSYISHYDEYSVYTNEYGKSYLCASYIDQNHIASAEKGNNEILIFNNFSNEQLFSISNEDTYTSGNDNNSLNLSSSKSNYMLPFDMACLTYSYNEFDFYRQDNNGNRMLPTAVLCYNQISGNAYNMAKRMNIPIVIINTKAYDTKNAELYNNYKIECLNGNLNNLSKLIGLSFKLKNKLKKEELSIIFSYLSILDIENIINILNKYKYDMKEILEIVKEEFGLNLEKKIDKK